MLYPQEVSKLELLLNQSYNFVADPFFSPREVMCLDSRSESGMTMLFGSGMTMCCELGMTMCFVSGTTMLYESGMIWVLGMWW